MKVAGSTPVEALRHPRTSTAGGLSRVDANAACDQTELGATLGPMNDVEEVDAPNCPDCFFRMMPAGDGERSWWVCPQCGLTQAS